MKRCNDSLSSIHRLFPTSFSNVQQPHYQRVLPVSTIESFWKERKSILHRASQARNLSQRKTSSTCNDWCACTLHELERIVSIDTLYRTDFTVVKHDTEESICTCQHFWSESSNDELSWIRKGSNHSWLSWNRIALVFGNGKAKKQELRCSLPATAVLLSASRFASISSKR